MDGGAYCTLTPVVLSRGVLHAGGPYRCENVRITGRAMATNTPPNGAFRGFGAPQTEFAAEMQVNRIADALDASPLDLRRRWVYREGDTTPTGQVLLESVGGIDVLEAAAEASAFDRHAGQTRAFREGRTDGARVASGIGLALAWHGAGFTGSGEVKLASVASLELTDDGRIRILTASTEMGQGTKTIFPQLVADTLGVEYGEVEIAPQDTSIVPDSGPTVASRTAMVVGGLLIRAAERTAREGRRGDRPPVRLGVPRGRTDANRRAVRPLPRRPVRRQDLHRRRLPRLRLGRVRCRGRGGPRHRRGRGARLRQRGRHRSRHPSDPRRGPGRGRHAAGDRLRDDRGDEARRWPLPQRSARDLPHPDLARRAAPALDPRREAVLAAPPTARRASASCRWTSVRRRSSPPSTTRPASGSTTCRPRPSGSSRPSPAALPRRRPASRSRTRRLGTPTIEDLPAGGDEMPFRAPTDPGDPR